MMKRKMITAGICAFVMSVSTMPMAFAAENEVVALNVEQQIVNAENGITDIPVTDEMKEQVEASFVNESGQAVPIEVDYTIKELGTVKGDARNASEGKIYAMTVVTRASEKPYDGNKKAYGVRAYGTVIWVDNFGPGNVLKEISGGWTAEESGSSILGDRSVIYGIYATGAGGTTSADLKTINPKSNTFSKSGLSMTGFRLGMVTNAKVQNRDGESGTLTLTCKPFN